MVFWSENKLFLDWFPLEYWMFERDKEVIDYALRVNQLGDV